MEATGLGGRDLSYPIPWDISIRSDKEGQSVYGPSLAPMEETIEVPGPFGGTLFVSLGFTKSWVGQVALRSPINRPALDLAVSLDDQGHWELVS